MEYKVEAIKPEYMKQLYTMLWRSYPNHYESSPQDFFKPYIENDPFHFNDNVRVIMDNEVIAGVIKIFYRETFINSEKKLLGGVGLVAVNPEYRGKGLAGILMNDIVSFMSQHKYNVSLLFAGPIPLYEKYGWKSMKTKEWFFSDFNIKSTTDAVLLRPISWVEDYSLIYKIHDTMIRRYNLGIIRNPAYWINYVNNFTAKKSRFFCIEIDGEIKGYIIFKHNLKDNNILIQEYGVLDDKFIEPLILSLAKRIKFVSVSVNSSGENTGLIKYLKNISNNIESNYADGMMFRNINDDINTEDKDFHDNTLFFGTDSF